MPSSLRLSLSAASAAADVVTARLNGGALRIYDGVQPATPDASPASARLLAECGFADPAFAPARGGLAVAHPLAVPRAVGTGAPAWFRAVRRDGRAVLDGSVGPERSGADLELSVATIQLGAEIAITDMSYTQPVSA